MLSPVNYLNILRQPITPTYNIETYFFIPQNLGISKATYSKYDFYNDLKTYIRFKTPSILLQNIANGTNTVLNDLKKAFEAVIAQPDRQRLIEYENGIKLFCCEFKSSLRDHVEYMGTNTKKEDVDFLLGQYIACIEKITGAYREFRNILNVPAINKDTFSRYLFGDEYISLVIEDYTYSLLSIIDKKDCLDSNEVYTERLLKIIRMENEYRKDNHYPSIAKTDSENEVLVFRKSILKKYMGNILFLDVRTENEGKFMEQIAFGIAAGLSMIFATVVAFFIQKSYGNLSFPLFIALVVSYMFKDRIKEILRIYLNGKLSKILYNYRTYLRTKNHEEIGWCKELFNFRDESEVPGEILNLRNKDHITEIENGWMGEQVILYKKMIRLFTNNFKDMGEIGAVDSINDIVRFNVQKFLAKMDDPIKPIFALSEDNYKKVFARRVYHLNMVIKYSFEDKAVFRRFRIVLNRKGIKSIETVNDKI